MSWLSRKTQEHEDWSGFLDDGVSIEGRLESKGTLRINSLVKGSLNCAGILIIGSLAGVEGDVTGKQVSVEGRINGTIHAESKVELHANAVVSGDIYASCLEIEPGALFDGQFHMVQAGQEDLNVLVPVKSPEGRS